MAFHFLPFQFLFHNQFSHLFFYVLYEPLVIYIPKNIKIIVNQKLEKNNKKVKEMFRGRYEQEGLIEMDSLTGPTWKKKILLH